MYMMKEETKQKYLADIRAVDRKYQDIFPKLNEKLKSYGTLFYDFSKGRLTDAYFRERTVAISDEIIGLSRDTVSSMLEQLKALEEGYRAEMYAGNATTDQMELNFTARELEVMDPEEMKEFYITNIGDENKRRLFHIEVKRRARSGNPEAVKEATAMEFFVQQFQVGDEVSRKLTEHIRFYGALVSAINGKTIWLIDPEKDGFDPKMFSIKEVFHAVEAKAAWGYPSKIDFYELMRIEKNA